MRGRLIGRCCAPLGLAFVVSLSLFAQEPVRAQDAQDVWQALNRQVVAAYQQGRYEEGARLAEEAYQLARESFGERHPDTLGSLNNLAFLYQSQGRYGEAEPLYEQALALRRDVLGERHPLTLTSLNNLAGLYSRQGRYGEAEPLYEQALALRRDVLGERHPLTLTSLNNLAGLYQSQGRYGEAEPLYEQALALSRDVLGERHPLTLTSLNNLAGLYQSQGRYGEAEPLYEQALALSRDVLGERHPLTLTSLNNLAGLYQSQGRYGEAEPLYEQALALSRDVLGERHPDTLTSLNNLAGLYQSQGRYGEAEPLYEQALALRRDVLGERHPLTLAVMLNTIGNLAALEKPDRAVSLLRQMQPFLLDRLAAELYSTEDVRVRRGLVASQSNFQDMALSLAIAFPHAADAGRVAALSLLRFKGLLAEEEAYLARLSRRSDSPSVQQAAEALTDRRQQLAAAYQGQADGGRLEELQRAVNRAELALGRVSRDYENQLQVRKASLEDLQGKLPAKAVLVEFRRYRRVDFGIGLAEARWAAVVLEGLERIAVVDLGETGDTAVLVGAAVTGREEDSAATSRTLYGRLIDKLALSAHITRLYIAPDDVLHLLPFHRLLDGAGRHLVERYDLRQIQTSRDLLRPAHDRAAKGLLALGGIDFGGTPIDQVSLEPGAFDPARGRMGYLRAVTAETFQKGFPDLLNTGPEVTRIEQLYRSARPQEPAEIWRADEASEARIKALARPPRVLHLATHGFYRPARDRGDRPMLLAGITLAGANKALTGEQEDGILYAIEAQDLNLEGTELVVLSACETARGEIGHGEGVYGLVRALRTAGAKQVLVTLRAIGDASAPHFMERFYRNWLSQGQGKSDPAAALQATQSHFIKTNPEFDWAPYVMIGG